MVTGGNWHPVSDDGSDVAVAMLFSVSAVGGGERLRNWQINSNVLFVVVFVGDAFLKPSSYWQLSDKLSVCIYVSNHFVFPCSLNNHRSTWNQIFHTHPLLL